MAGPLDVLTTIQNGVVALNDLGRQVSGSFTSIKSQLAAITSSGTVTSIAGNSGAFTLNGASGLTNAINDIQLSPASTSQFGSVKVDGTTITAAAGIISGAAAATKAQQQTGTSSNTYASPLHQQDHDSAAKAWVTFTASSATVLASYNISSVSRTAVGNYVINFSTVFSSSNYVGIATTMNSGNNTFAEWNNSVFSSSQAGLFTLTSTGATLADPNAVMAVFYGRQ